jgi:hypothetical protein
VLDFAGVVTSSRGAGVPDATEIVQTIYGSIQKYAGFNRQAWLD